MSSIIVDKQSAIFFSTSSALSDPNIVITNKGSKMNINLDKALGFPTNAMYCNVEIQNVTLQYVTPNVDPSRANDKFDYSINGVAQPTITITPGLYSLNTLNTSLGRDFVAAGQPANMVSFIANDSTQRVTMVLGIDNVQVDFSALNSVGSIMGYVGIQPAGLELTGFTVDSTQQATFNKISSFVLRSDFISGGIPVNNSGFNVLATIPITARIGSQNIYAPFNPIQVDASELRGRVKSSFFLQLTDQDGNDIDTLGEPWSVLMVFRWGALLSSANVPLMDV
jgi:hypothetical protein